MDDTPDLAFAVYQSTHYHVVNISNIHVIVNVKRESFVKLALCSDNKYSLILNSLTCHTCQSIMHHNMSIS